MVFFFFFGGVAQEVQTVIQSQAVTCPLCASPASLVEYDNVLRLFFIHVWKWSGDNPAIKCTSCSFLTPLNKFNSIEEAMASRNKIVHDWTPMATKLQCWSCLAPVESANFKFCPQCGVAL